MRDRFSEFTTLVVSAYKKMKKIKKQQSCVYDTLNIRGPHVMCLYYLGQYPEGLTITELASLCYEDKAATSRTVDYLVEKKYLINEEDDVKRRWRSKIKLTEEGTEVVKTINRVILKASAVVTSDIPEEELECFYRVFEKMLNNMDQLIAE